MNIKITKKDKVYSVKTVDGTFKFQLPEEEEKTDALVLDEDTTVLTISELLRNVFTITQNDKLLFLEETDGE